MSMAVTGVLVAQEMPAPAEPEALPPAAEAVVEPAAARTPLMGLLDKAGIGSTLDEYNINITGWVEASITWSLLERPAGDVIVGRAFDFEHSDPTLNQIGPAFSRHVDMSKPWDIGFSIETLYGADGRFTASNGMDFQTGTSPNNQFDITQAAIDVVVPVGNGLKVRIGKFITPIGYEYTNNTLNPNFSHSYLFGLLPFAHTGVYATYAFDDSKSFSLGIARGWEQSLKDNNDSLEVVWSWAHVCSDKFTYAFNGSIGPQQDDDNSHYRVMLDYWSDYAFSDQLTIGLNVDYRYDSANASDGDGSNVFGVATYFKYTLNDYVGLMPRLEWFNDTSRLDGFDAHIYSATLGVTITPFPNDSLGSNLKIRPESRYDYASEAIYDGGEEHDVLSLAISGYFTF